jgi:polysaccharide chain length determinant protein (PEP-CTERM system associated)
VQKAGVGRNRIGVSAGKRQGVSDPLRMLIRRKWLALAIIATVLTVAGSVTFSLPEIYQATATILVERQQLPESVVQSTVTSEVSRRLQTITRQLLSPDRLQQLIQQFDLYADWQAEMPLKQIIARMQQDIQLEQQRSQQRRSSITTAFTLSYRGSDPRKVAQVTNALASLYIEENVKVREQQATGTSQFIEEQLAVIRKKLEAQEQQMSQYKEKYIGELPEQLSANISTLERFNAQLHLNSEKLARANERHASLVRQLAGAQGAGSTAAMRYNTLRTQLATLQQQLQVLRTRFSDKYPTVIRLKEEIATLERQLDDALPNGADAPNAPVEPNTPERHLLQAEIDAVNTEIKVLRTEEQNLLRSLNVYQQRVENTPRHERELHMHSRDYEITQALYHSLLKRLEEAKLAESMEQNLQGEQFRLLESATPPTRPASPNRVRLLLVAASLSLGLAVGAAFVVERLDTSFHSVDDLRAYVDVPVLQSLPHIAVKSVQRRRQWRFALAMVATVCLLGVIAGLTHHVAKDNTQLVRLLAL